MLKKKRKKMQGRKPGFLCNGTVKLISTIKIICYHGHLGWAKRWFHLSPSGVLSYSTSPTSVTRGSIQIMLATISSNPDQRMIHIDSGTMLYHLRTLSEEDHERWTSAFRAYRSGAIENDDQQLNHECSPAGLVMNGGHDMNEAVEKGIRGSAALTADVAQLSSNLNLLTDLLQQLARVAGTRELTERINDLSSQLTRDQKAIQGGVDEQHRQWRLVQEALAASGGTSYGPGPVTNLTESPEDHALRKSMSARSSVLSEDFYDAEDIILAADDDDDFTEGGDTTAGDASSDEDDEDGM